jgi:hypothetical protein
MALTGKTGTREFSNDAYKHGDLKRRLTTTTLAMLTNDGVNIVPAAGVEVFRRVVKNLNRGISLHIACGVAANDPTVPVEAAVYPPGALTMQLTPVTVFGDANKLFLRPVFQDPTSTVNQNLPQPQDLPFGWEGETLGDEVYIDISVNKPLLLGMNVFGRLLLEVTVEYSGSWPFPEAVKYMLSQVQLTGGSNLINFDTREPG